MLHDNEVILTSTNYPLLLAEAVLMGKEYISALRDQARRQGYVI